MRGPGFLAAVLAALLLVAAPAALAQGFEPFVAKDIRVEGLGRLEPGTIFTYLPLKVGDLVDERAARAAVQALYATGFFQDVRLEADGDVLVVVVRERPSIAQIDFSGMRQINAEAVRSTLRELGLAEARIFDRSVLENAEQEIKRQYLARGLYGAEVQTTITPLERNRVGISISVIEGEIAKIRGINLVGAEAFPEEELLDQFVLRTPGWLTWYTKHDLYSRERLAADLETLRDYYQNRGYLDFNVESTQISFTPDRRDIYITVNLREGEKYTVSDVTLSGQMPVPREELEKLVQLEPGDVFSREKLTASTRAIAERLGNEGYAFANANAIPEIDKEKRTVSFNIFVDPARRVYVRRIDIAGNTKTSDEVIRREMRQLEGAFYDASKIQLSRRRIDRTQYFSAVTVQTRPVENRNDMVDVVYTVAEKPTGAVLFGVGLTTEEDVSFSTSLTQSNVFGTGKFLSLNLNTGSINTVYSLSYLNPYWTINGVSRGFDVYRRETDASRLVIGRYRTDAVGGGLKFGYPISETTSVNFGINLESVELETFAESPALYRRFVEQFGNEYAYGAGVASLIRDTRNSLIRTTAGSYMRVSSEFAGGDLEYGRLAYEHQWYYPLTERLTLLLAGEIGYAEGRGGKPLPFFKNYFAGGPGTVRGYRSFSLGPRDEEGNSLGGNRKLTGSAEVLFPMPGAIQDPSLRLAAFIDGGQVFVDRYEPSDLRYSAGVGLFWSSPIGPLRLSIAYPLNEEPGDELQRIQFTFGTGF